MTGARRTPRGFTLIEISVGLLLIALLTGVAVPTYRSVTAAQLRRTAGQVAGMSREAYARAAITGKPHRIVFNLDDNTFWMEQASGFFVLKHEKKAQLTEQEIAQRAAAPGGGSSGDDDSSDESERLKRSLDTATQWSPVDDDLGRPTPLPADCAFERVWVAHQSEAFVRGESHVHYWPAGRAETAIIRLTDDPETNSRIITVKINGLTGRSMVLDRAVEIPTS